MKHLLSLSFLVLVMSTIFYSVSYAFPFSLRSKPDVENEMHNNENVVGDDDYFYFEGSDLIGCHGYKSDTKITLRLGEQVVKAVPHLHYRSLHLLGLLEEEGSLGIPTVRRSSSSSSAG